MVSGKVEYLAQNFENEGGNNSGVKTRPVDDRSLTPISKSNSNFNLSSSAFWGPRAHTFFGAPIIKTCKEGFKNNFKSNQIFTMGLTPLT